MSHLKRIQNKNGRRKPVFDPLAVHFWRKRAYERDYKKAKKLHEENLRKARENDIKVNEDHPVAV